MDAARKKRILEKTSGALRNFIVDAVHARAAGKDTAEQALATKMQQMAGDLLSSKQALKSDLRKGNLSAASNAAEFLRSERQKAVPVISAWKDLTKKLRAQRSAPNA